MIIPLEGAQEGAAPRQGQGHSAVCVICTVSLIHVEQTPGLPWVCYLQELSVI